METRDVDALWQELAMENEYRGVEVSRLLHKSMAMGRTAKKSAKASQIAHVSATHSDPDAFGRGDGKIAKHEEAFSLPKVLNRLAAEQRSVRKKAAVALETQFLKGDAKEQASLETADKATATDAFAEMAKPLFKRFNDPVEKVREICIRITTKCIAKEEDLLRYLPYLMPAITNRINSQYGYDEENQVFSRDQFLHDAFNRGRVYVAENQVARIKPDEPSEEIRLLLLGLVDAVLQNAFERRASSILHAYVFDILMVLISGVHDDFHDINIASCHILAAISNHMVSVMKHFSVATVRTLMPLLLHRLARVRVAVVEAIRALVTCPNVEKCKGSGTEAIVDLIGHRDENVIPVASFYTAEVRLNYFAKLDQDRNPMVRRAFFAMIRDWMVNLPDRYDHESRLLPYLLSAVSDEDPAISAEALQTLEILGERYEREHGEEVIEMKQYGVDGKNPTYNYGAPLPAPFVAGRPSLGTRLFVRGRARRFLNPILRELANWQDSTRAHAVRLLKCVLVYCEETITVDVHLLVNTLLRTWGGDHDLLLGLRQCADLAGRFAAPRTYLPLLLSRIRGDSDVVVPLAATMGGGATAVSQTAVALEVLHCLLQGSLDKMVLPHVSEILDTIALFSILDLESTAVKLALGQVLLRITKLLERSGSDAVTAFFLERGRLTSLEQSYSRIFDIGVVVVASSYCSAAVAEASSALKRLAALETLTSIDQLYATHSSSLLRRALQDLQGMLAVQWSPHSAAQLALEQILTSAPVALLLEQGAELNDFFRSILQPDQPSTTADVSCANSSSPNTAAAGEENAKKTRHMRKQRFEQVLKGVVGRVLAQHDKQGEPAASSTRAAYAELWEDLLSATKAAAA
ncbi:HEAT repeat-containing protein 2 [Phytophthora pseudosyringae]|uniref:HEAT repeat-containing protein 2 n=1 Tax=Phytophthora pseudosyringae TaxID=221518 RepID=A0A8T1VPU5_9STRA|nr:HEAT repeat-containing protein 2 [Phytophthora pseudosyringae]